MSTKHVHRVSRFILSGDDQAFLSELRRVVYSNPFSPGRDARLAALLAGEGVPGHPALNAIVARRLERFDTPGTARLEQFAAEDRPLLEAACLYVIYHRYLEDFDAHIELQARDSAPLRLDFAADLAADFAARGFSHEDVPRHIAMFFQLRRAFYFIERSLPGDSQPMRELRLSLWNNTFTHDMRTFDRHLWNRMEEFSTLLLGETGTGKGSAAAAIGRSAFIPYDPARRRFAASFADTFVALNLSQFPESLVESELFGHRKGAFTGAVADHAGIFERCSEHGALFLDEMGEIALPLQVKLLQVLQERTFSALGSHERLHFHGRVIAASNRSLDELRAEGAFRDDLFYRLCSDVIVVPPLRERLRASPAELGQLVEILVGRAIGADAGDLTGHVLEVLDRDLPAH